MLILLLWEEYIHTFFPVIAFKNCKTAISSSLVLLFLRKMNLASKSFTLFITLLSLLLVCRIKCRLTSKNIKQNYHFPCCWYCTFVDAAQDCIHTFGSCRTLLAEVQFVVYQNAQIFLRSIIVKPVTTYFVLENQLLFSKCSTLHISPVNYLMDRIQSQDPFEPWTCNFSTQQIWWGALMSCHLPHLRKCVFYFFLFFLFNSGPDGLLQCLKLL